MSTKSGQSHVTQDAYLDTETNRYAEIMLPGALWAEAEGVTINSERNLTLMQKAVEPPGEALPDWQIIATVACEMGYQDGFSFGSAAEVFEERKQAANPIRFLDVPSGTNDGVQLSFSTESGKARFFARPHLPPAELPDDEFPIVLNTGRLQH